MGVVNVMHEAEIAAQDLWLFNEGTHSRLHDVLGAHLLGTERDGTADKGMDSLWGFYAQSPSERATQIMDRLLDLGEHRLAHMDATGIDKAILELTSPGVQPMFDVEEARGIARRANDYLSKLGRPPAGKSSGPPSSNRPITGRRPAPSRSDRSRVSSTLRARATTRSGRPASFATCTP